MIDEQPLTRKALQALQLRSNNIVTIELTSALLLIHDVYDAVRAAREHFATKSGNNYDQITAWMTRQTELNDVARLKQLQVEVALGVKEMP